MLFSDTSKNQSQIPSKNDQRSIVVMTTELSGLTVITTTDARQLKRQAILTAQQQTRWQLKR